MDTFGLEAALIINLQLEQMQKQFINACTRLNIVASFPKPTVQWLENNIRGKFKTSDCKTSFVYSKDYSMQWEIKCDKGDIYFEVQYEEDVFNAIEPHFHIQEYDREIIVGYYEIMHRSTPLPVRKDVTFVCEDLTIRVDGIVKKSMPDHNGKLYFGDLSQKCNWPLNVAPPVLQRSPPLGLPPVTAGHAALGLARAEPTPRPARSEPMLHTLVSQQINRHNLRLFDPKVPPPPPPRMNAHFSAVSAAAAGQPSHHKELADWPQANTSRQIRDLKKSKKKILPSTDLGDSSSEISGIEPTQRKKHPKPTAASTPKKRAQNSRDELIHEYDSISESQSETEHQKLCKEFERMINIALKGRESDPLSEFIVETVPRIIEFLSFREGAPLNSSGNQAREETFTKEIEQLYGVTKAAIIRENDNHKSQSNTNETSQSNANENMSHTIQHIPIVHQPEQNEPELPHSINNVASSNDANEIVNQIVTRSKSVRGNDEPF